MLLPLLFMMQLYILASSTLASEGVPQPVTDRKSLSVELHAHLFMKEGMSWLFRGDFEGPIRAHSWTDKLSSQTNAETLDDSGIGILVVSLYAHPFLTFSLRDSIRRQIKLTEVFVKQHPNWIIARSSLEAHRALSQGKRILILSLEGASGILETEEDLKEFVDRDGLRIVTLLHLTDDEYGGVAFLRGFRAMASPLAWTTQLFHPLYSPDDEGIQINRKGLTDRGFKLAQALLKRGIWIDLAHSSDVSQEALIPLLKNAGHPLLYTHTVLRNFHQAERGISEKQLLEVKNTQGIVGLMPSEEMLEGTQVPNDSCTGGVVALGVQYEHIAGIIGSASTVLGTDYNGGITHLKPGCATETSLDQYGLYNISQTKEIWIALQKLGVHTPVPLSSSVDRFLNAWGSVRTPGEAMSPSELLEKR